MNNKDRLAQKLADLGRNDLSIILEIINHAHANRHNIYEYQSDVMRKSRWICIRRAKENGVQREQEYQEYCLKYEDKVKEGLQYLGKKMATHLSDIEVEVNMARHHGISEDKIIKEVRLQSYLELIDREVSNYCRWKGIRRNKHLKLTDVLDHDLGYEVQ